MIFTVLLREVCRFHLIAESRCRSVLPFNWGDKVTLITVERESYFRYSWGRQVNLVLLLRWISNFHITAEVSSSFSHNCSSHWRSCIAAKQLVYFYSTYEYINFTLMLRTVTLAVPWEWISYLTLILIPGWVGHSDIITEEGNSLP